MLKLFWITSAIFWSMLFAEEKDQGAELAATLRLTISAKTERFAPNEMLVIQVALENTGIQPIALPYTNPMQQFTFSVKGPRKEIIPLTREGQRLIPFAESFSRSVLAPGAARKFAVFHFNRVFDMSIMHKYTISVSVTIPGDKGKFIPIVSNEIQVELIEPKGYQTVGGEVPLK